MKKIYILLLVSALFTTSCNDWLDVKPQAKVEVNDLFASTKGFKDALVACYIKMNGNNLYGQALTMTITEYLAQFWDHTSGNYREEDKLKDFDYTTAFAESTFSNIYGNLYNVIAQANIVLDNLNNKKGVIKNENMHNLIQAEALCIRAFCHMDVLRMFGQLPQGGSRQVQLPYAKEVSTAKVPYYPYQQFTEMLLADIESAQQLFRECDPVMTYTFGELDHFSGNADVELEDEFMGYRRFRFNYYAAEALKARLYLYMGNKEKALEAATNVISAKSKEGKPMLELAGNDEFNSKCYALPSECILALNNDKIKENTDGLFGQQFLFLNKSTFKQLFVGQDVSRNNRALHAWNTITDNQGTQKHLLRKYQQPEKAEDISDMSVSIRHQVLPLMRLSEMYLIAIECATTLEDANRYYKTYMEARDVEAASLTEANLQEEILNEYRREFFGEGQMFYTYKRLNIKKMLWKRNREVEEKDYIVPLPSTELGSN
ncbi:MAG: RagB/SusD family nutrient uptake outer membrane protein [Odoribacter sp.]|nr:RagB/SusD family nutrient uptake outer membrane protein [Odoribacter sp.]